MPPTLSEFLLMLIAAWMILFGQTQLPPWLPPLGELPSIPGISWPGLLPPGGLPNLPEFPWQVPPGDPPALPDGPGQLPPGGQPDLPPADDPFEPLSPFTDLPYDTASQAASDPWSSWSGAAWTASLAADGQGVMAASAGVPASLGSRALFGTPDDPIINPSGVARLPGSGKVAGRFSRVAVGHGSAGSADQSAERQTPQGRPRAERLVLIGLGVLAGAAALARRWLGRGVGAE